MRTATIIFFLLALSFLDCTAQNLLANGSFEDENVCTEYHQKCSPSGWINFAMETPVLINSYASDGKPFDGKHFVKILAWDSEYKGLRTFISSRILCGLREGQKYILKFYYRASDHAADSLGVHLSSIDFLSEKRPISEIVPNVWLIDSAAATKQSDWIRVSHSFVADGTESFITIGSFKKSQQYSGSEQSIQEDVYFYLDDVTLIPANKNERACASSDSITSLLYKQRDRHGRLLARQQSSKRNPRPFAKSPKTTILNIDTLTISDLSFSSGSSSLNDESVKALDAFLKTSSDLILDSIVIEGHTDNTGNKNENQSLSASRAAVVLEYLSQIPAIPADKIFSRFFGAQKPVAPNDQAEGRRKNRRVEVFVYRHL